jgi:hypothetical protein
MRIVLNLFVAAACASLVGVVSASCASTTCEGEGTCNPGATPPGVDGGSEGGADVIAPPNCDLTKGLKDSPACVDDSVGVFVSPNGDDGATGKKATPAKSITKGVELAASRGLPRVYVCEGTYDANVEIKSSLSLYGGLSCSWAYTGAKPKLAPAKGIALRVTKVSSAVVVEDFEVVGSADAGTPGDSAIAAFVSESTNVAFRRTNLAAGAGTEGAKGPSAANWSVAATMGTTAVSGGAAVLCNCTDATSSSGGKGGAIGVGGDPGTATPSVGPLNGGGGGNMCTAGGSGDNGPAGGASAPATISGSAVASGWSNASDAKKGTNGKPAQGGGGGGGKTGVAGGGGGGCGGCGGAGGGPGGSGGSSFALLTFQSTVAVDSGVLKTSGGGGGGPGGPGQDGQAGAGGGVGACDGGPGGNGAGGSGGGGGAGGHSVPIAFVGPEPKVTEATVMPGAKGAAGPGGTAGAGPGNPGAPGTPGPEGKSQNTLSLQ